MTLIGLNYADNDIIRLRVTNTDLCVTAPNFDIDSVILEVIDSIVPTVNVVQTPGNPICTGTPVRFTAVYTGGGASPTFQWRLNGVPVGTNSDTFSLAVPANGDRVTVSMNSSLNCTKTGFDSASSELIVSIPGTLTPTVTIVQNPTNPVCNGDSITLTANTLGAGANPKYVWFINGSSTPLSTDSTQASIRRLASTVDSVRVLLIPSNTGCLTATTAQYRHIVQKQSAVTPTITISQLPGNPVCPGENVVFTATTAGAGPGGIVRWYRNGTFVQFGTNYTLSASANDSITAVLVSNASCRTTDSVSSYRIIQLQNPVFPTVQIIRDKANPVCTNEVINFTAQAAGQGNSPSIQWFRNGNLVGSGYTYQGINLANNDVITVRLQSSANCAPPASLIVWDSTQIIVTPTTAMTVGILQNPTGTLCIGEPATFVAQVTGGAGTINYEWTINGGFPLSTDPIFVRNVQASDNLLILRVSSNSSCVTNSPQFAAQVLQKGSTITPTVNIVDQNPTNPFCSNASVTFTASSSGGGSNPVYRWFVNDTLRSAGTSLTFSTTGLNNGDVVRVSFTSTSPCGNNVTVSATRIVNTTPSIPLTVNASIVGGDTICTSQVAFVLNINSTGAIPFYYVYRNSVSVANLVGFGASPVAVLSSLVPDSSRLIVQVNALPPPGGTCVSPSINYDTVLIRKIDTVAPTVVIQRTPSGPVCSGNNVVLEAVATGQGSNPVYLWQNAVTNDTLAFGNVPTLNLLNVDSSRVIRVTVRSSLSCASPQSVSDIDSITIAPGALVPSVTISQNPANPICSNSTEIITFTPNPVNGGSTPQYMWFVNGDSITNSVLFSTPFLFNNDTVRVRMTSSASCSSTPVVFSAPIIIKEIDTALTVTNPLSGPAPYCVGDTVRLSVPAQAGVTVQWFNGASPIPGATDTILRVSANGNYSARLSNTRCTGDIRVVNLNFNALPNASVTQSADSLFCFGDSIVISVTTPQAGNTFAWFKNGLSTVLGTNSSFAAKELGNYSVVVTSDSGCTSRSRSVYAYPIPAIDTTLRVTGLDTLCKDDSVILSVNPFARADSSLRLQTNGWLLVGDDPLLDFNSLQSFTIEAWINFVDSMPDGTAIVSKSAAFGNTNGYQLLLHRNRVSAELGNGTLPDNLTVGPATGFVGSTRLNDGRWHHIALSVNKNTQTATLYVDGRPEISVNNPIVGGDFSNGDGLFIGKNKSSLGFSLDRLMT